MHVHHVHCIVHVHVGGAVEVALTGRPEDELATGSGSGLEYGLMASGNETSLQGLHWHQQALGYLCSMLDSFCSVSQTLNSLVLLLNFKPSISNFMLLCRLLVLCYRSGGYTAKLTVS